MWKRSITVKLLSVITVAFIITTVCILAASNLKLKQIVDKSQDAVYSEKVDKIIGSLERSNEKLERTGLVEVYREDFQDSQLKIIEKDYYKDSSMKIFPFIIDMEGNIVLHPGINNKKNYKNTLLGKTILSSPEGTFNLVMNGEKVWGVFKAFKEWKWVICYIIPHEIKYNDVTKFRNTLILIILFITLIVLFFLSAIVAKFVKPVVQLTKISREIAEGNLDQKVIPESKDEIGTLAENFEQMRIAVKNQIIEIKNGQKRAENIIEGTNAGAWEMDYRNNIIKINDRWAEIIGETKESLGIIMPENMKNRIHPDDYEKVNDIFYSHIRGEKNFFEIEFRIKHSSGNWVWVHEHGKIVERDSDGNPITLSGTHIDITERKKNEYEITKLRNFLSNIINSMPSIIVGVDLDGIITQWNRTAEKNSGIEADKAEGSSLFDVYPGMINEFEKIKECIRSREIRKIHKRAYKLEHGIGYENVTIFPLITNGVEGAVIRIDDVTDNVRMEEIIIQSEKMLSVGGLAAGMAHEINNPLAGMMQTANVLHDRLGKKIKIPASEKAAAESGTTTESIKAFMEKRGVLKMLKTIVDSGSRLADIVDNMLSFARKSESLRSSEKPDKLMDSILKLAATDYDLKENFDFKSILIIKEYEENLPQIPCEGSKIQQVILNILKNGAQAMQEHVKTIENYKPQFTLRILREEENKTLRIEIEDNGPGMTEDVRRRVFEPFFTTKPVGIGTGLGLSVSYFIVTENHGGTMDVESEPGKGTRFIIRIPLEINEHGGNLF